MLNCKEDASPDKTGEPKMLFWKPLELKLWLAAEQDTCKSQNQKANHNPATAYFYKSRRRIKRSKPAYIKPIILLFT